MLSHKKWILLGLAILIGALGIYPFCLPQSEKAMADVLVSLDLGEEQILDYQIIQETTLLASVSPLIEENLETVRKIKVTITGYSSTEDQTDSDPFITAAGTLVRDGILASNLLPFGTKVKIPELFGDKIFVVEDRMSWKKGEYQMDIWFPARELALEFGVKKAEALILLD